MRCRSQPASAPPSAPSAFSPQATCSRSSSSRKRTIRKVGWSASGLCRSRNDPIASRRLGFRTVDTGEKLRVRAGADELVEERLERGVVRAVEIVRRLAQLGNALSKPAAVLRVLPDVKRESAFGFPLRNGIHVRAEREQRPMLDPGEAAQHPHGVVDRGAGTSGVVVCADACEGRDRSASTRPTMPRRGTPTSRTPAAAVAGGGPRRPASACP